MVRITIQARLIHRTGLVSSGLVLDTLPDLGLETGLDGID